MLGVLLAPPPSQGKGVLFFGFPGKERMRDKNEIIAGSFTGFCVPEIINEQEITIQFKKKYLIEGLTKLYDKSYSIGEPLGGLSGRH